MTWKQGKHRTGRTVRSSFPRRNEGILVLKKERKTDSDEAEQVLYSLGKQNRWMMPELVKEMFDFRSDLGDEDFVLVDRKTRRINDISVYESASGNVWGSNGKNSNTSEANVVLEVTYPNHKGVWPFDTNVKYHETPKRKKCKRGSKNRHVNIDDWNSEDVFYGDLFDAECESQDDSVVDRTVSLGDYISESVINNNKLSSIAKPSKELIENDCSIDNDKESSTYSLPVDDTCQTSSATPRNKVVFIDDEELAKKHQKMYDIAQKRDRLLETILYDVHDCTWCWEYCWDNKKKRIKRQRYLRKKLSCIGEEVEDNAEPNKEQEKTALDGSFANKHCKTSLVDKDLEVSELRRVWGEKYNEGESHPRKFAINISDSFCLPNKTNLVSVHILFELQSNGDKLANHHHASIKLLIDSELSELKIPQQTAELIIKDFCEDIETSSDVVSVKDVVEKARMYIEKHSREPTMKKRVPSSKRSASLNVIEGVLGWKGEMYTEQEALTEIKEEMENKLTKCEDPLIPQSPVSAAECGVCFEDLTSADPNTFTTLKSCEHSFCNECWKMYIHTKLTSGQVDLLCPGHSCKTVVDPVTVMALAPSWYGKYYSWKVKRSMAASASWKNCPSDKCNLVMKVLPCDKDNVSSIPTRLPVSCSCKSIWCYGCQEQAHWPSTCETASTFRAANTGKAGKMGLSEITSVAVKKCPKCGYPIEKHEGCNHMYCTLCYTGFCWYCLATDTENAMYFGNHDCYAATKEKRSTVVELPLLLSDAQRFANIAVSGHCIVKAGMTVKKECRLKSMKQGLEAYSSLTNVSKIFHTSHLGSILDNMIKSKAPDVLRKAYTFELQAHVALEGMAIGVVSGDKTFLEQCTILSYLMEKLADILNNPYSFYKAKNVARLNELIETGQTCLKRLN